MYDNAPEYPDRPTQLVSESTVTRGATRVSRAGLIAALAVVVGAAGFAVTQASSDPAGPETREDAVAQFWEALDNEDVVGLIEVLLPSERESLIIPATNVLLELARLDVATDDVISEGGDVEFFAGFEFDIPGPGEPNEITYEIAPVGGNEAIQWITTTGGVASANVDPQKFVDLMGGKVDVLRDQIEPEDLEPESTTTDFAESYAEGNPFEFAIVEEDGYYYFSIYYTIAGNASEGRVPNFAAAPRPNGAATPEEAAVQLLDTLVDLDAKGVLATLDPQEFRAAYDYWSEWSPDLVDGLDEALGAASEQGVSWDLVSAEATSSNRDGRTVATYTSAVFAIKSTNQFLETDLLVAVTTDSLSVTGTLDREPISIELNSQRIDASATFNSDPLEIHIDLETLEGSGFLGETQFETWRDGDCLMLSADDESTSFCGDDLQQELGSRVSGLSPDLFKLDTDYYSSGIVVVERDGLWYVSGGPTISYAIAEYLKLLEPADLDQLIERLEDLAKEGRF
jgi:hypothetical protein